MFQVFGECFKYWTSGGVLLLVIAAVCFAMWFVLLQLDARYRKALRLPQTIEHEVLQSVSRTQSCTGLVELARKIPAPFSNILHYLAECEAKGMNLLEAFREARDEELEPFERDMMVLQALISAAPLLGLLGTVLGMVGTFQAISLQMRETTGLMSSGISQALITTQFGLLVAIPGLLAVSALRRKHKQLMVRLSALQQHIIIALQNGRRS